MAEAPARVLLVDDDTALLRVYERVLAGARRNSSENPLDLTFLSASETAAETVERACRDGRSFAIAFVDYDFPTGPNGVELARAFLAIDPHLEVVVCSSMADQFEGEVTQAIEPTDRLFILKKPFAPVEIRQLTAGLVKKWQFRREGERQVDALKELDRLKDELLSTVSHELRTPLTSLRGFSELLLTREFPRDKQKEILGVILDESMRLERLVTDFLDLQRSAQGRMEYRFEEDVDLRALIVEAIKPFAMDAQGCTRVTLEPGPGAVPLRADPERLRQVLANYISNALKFSPDDAAVTVTLTAEGDDIVVSVLDRGVGIPEAALPQLFTRFYRVDNSATRSVGGSGLGLSLVKAIVEGHGGRAGVETKLGEGSRFWFSLPGRVS